MAELTQRMVLDALAVLGVVVVPDPQYAPDPSAPPMPSLIGVLGATADNYARAHKFDPHNVDRETQLMASGYIQGSTDVEPDTPAAVEQVMNNAKVRAAILTNVLFMIGGAQLAHANQHAATLLTRLMCMADVRQDVRQVALEGIVEDLAFLNRFVTTLRNSVKGEPWTSTTESSPRTASSSRRTAGRRRNRP